MPKGDGRDIIDIGDLIAGAHAALERGASSHAVAQKHAAAAYRAGRLQELIDIGVAFHGDTFNVAVLDELAHDHGQQHRPVGPVVLDLSTVTPRAVEWLRPQRWPKGKLSLLVGDPGLGKSLLLLDAAARISTGTPWPEGSSTPPGRVLLLTAEDGLDDTVVPRLQRMGADLARIRVLKAIRENGKERLFNLADDIDQLQRAIEQVDPVAVFIDPLTAYLGKSTDSHADADVRTVLHPVATLADQFNVATIALMHLNKATQMRALYRVSGSVAFTAAARSVFAVVEEGETGRRLFAPLKMNLAPKPGTLAFRIQGGDVPALDWEPEPVADVDVEAALRGTAPEDSGSRNAREDAKEFLQETLAAGPVSYGDIMAEFEASGIASKRTLKTAKDELRIKSRKRQFEGGWEWYFPAGAAGEGCKDASTHETVAPLGGSKAESQETARVSPKGATSSRLGDKLHPSGAEGGGLTNEKIIQMLDLEPSDDVTFDPKLDGEGLSLPERERRRRALGGGWK